MAKALTQKKKIKPKPEPSKSGKKLKAIFKAASALLTGKKKIFSPAKSAVPSSFSSHKKKKPPLTAKEINALLPAEGAIASKLNGTPSSSSSADKNKSVPATAKPAGDDDILIEDDKLSSKKDAPSEEEESGNSGGGIEEYGRSRMDDPVRMYLRQMGQIPLLTRQEEIAIAKKIEDCEAELKKAVYETKAARFEVLELARKIVNDEINLESIVDEDQETTLLTIKKKLKKLIGRLRASRKSANLVDLLMQFNLNIGIVEKIVSNLRAKIAELKQLRDELEKSKNKLASETVVLHQKRF